MTGWAVETLLSSTLLMLLVLATRKSVRGLVGARVAYALWAIPAVRLAMPPLPEGWRGAMLPELPSASDGVIMLGEPVLALPAHPETGIGWPMLLIGIWVAGAIALFAWHAVGYWHFCRRLRRGTRRRHSVADGRIAVIETSAAPGPLAFGILSPTIALPRDFADRYDLTERNLAMAHELGHHLRGDLFANWIAITVLAFHWFNPVAWRAFRAFRTDQEMACDETVLASRGSDIRHAYARAIVKSANGASLSVACHMHTVDDLKGRLRMLGRTGASMQRRLGGGAGLLVLALAGLGLTAGGTRAAERMRVQVEHSTGVDFADLDEQVVAFTMPEPPAPPPAPDVPEVPAAADAPPAPPSPPAPRVGLNGHQLVMDDDGTRLVVKDGHARVFRDGIEVPSVTSANCGADAGAPVVIRGRQGDTRAVTICTDRINARVAEAQRRAWTAHREAERASRDAERMGREAERAGRDAERAAAIAERNAERAAAIAERDSERSAALAEAHAERAAALAEAYAERSHGLAEAGRARAEAGRAYAEASRNGVAAARAGLQHARRSLASNEALSGETRERALAEIDRELERLAH